MMLKIDNYIKLECLFFLVIYLVFPILTDYEYAYNEDPNQLSSEVVRINILRRIIFMIFQIIPFIVLYYFIIKGTLLKGHYLKAGLYLLLYLIILHFYHGYIMYPFLKNATFLPIEITKQYQNLGNTALANFGIVYMLHHFIQISALGFFVNYDKKRQETIELANSKAKSELEALKAQLHPHFLFNTLNNIYSLAEEGSPLTAPIIAKASDLMRYLLDSSKKEKILLPQEIEFIKNYFEIQSLRYQAKHKIKLEIIGDPKKIEIPPLLFLPFVENSFKHGLEHAIDNSFIEALFTIEDKNLTFSISNSNNSYSDNRSTSGIGLENVKKRLDILFKDKYQLSEEANGKTYQMNLILSL